uniref:Uncharacterized protein n=1 Tax=Romanomermis culicivorax TaxID=13658 RepID=A0A915K107_ROMCU
MGGLRANLLAAAVAVATSSTRRRSCADATGVPGDPFRYALWGSPSNGVRGTTYRVAAAENDTWQALRPGRPIE